MKKIQWRMPMLACLLASTVLAAEIPDPNSALVDKAANKINAANILNHIKILSSDEFEGRAPVVKVNKNRLLTFNNNSKN